jgi:sugar lactone lactonase YvrE
LVACDQGEEAGVTARVELVQAWELAGFKEPESVVFEAGEGVLYVSNVAGSPMEKDGVGHISKVSLDGQLIEEAWVDGLDAPKGLAVSGGKLYVADIDTLVEIDLGSKKTRRFPAAGAKFFNDVAADSAGRVYVSDMMGDAIWRLADGSFEKWLEDPALEGPNGLLAEDGRLVVGCWGVITEGFSTSKVGHLKTVSLADKSISSLGDGTPVGNLDGLEPDGKGGYFVTDWMAGALLHILPSGESHQVLDLNQGSADHEYIMDERQLIIPMMNDGKVVAYRVK